MENMENFNALTKEGRLRRIAEHVSLRDTMESPIDFIFGASCIAERIGMQLATPQCIGELTDVYRLPLTGDMVNFLKKLIQPLTTTAYQTDGAPFEGHMPDVLMELLNRTHRTAMGPYVSIYHTTRAYGGPEEGGWLYPRREVDYSYDLSGLDEFTLQELMCQLLDEITQYPGGDISAAPTSTELVDSYYRLVSGEHYQSVHGECPLHCDWSAFPLDSITHTIWVDDRGYDRYDLVFEWTPGNNATRGGRVYK